jgi:hypothetical protein
MGGKPFLKDCLAQKISRIIQFIFFNQIGAFFEDIGNPINLK